MSYDRRTEPGKEQRGEERDLSNVTVFSLTSALWFVSKGASTSFVMLLVDGKILLHIVRGAQDDRDSLVDVGGLDVQNVL